MVQTNVQMEIVFKRISIQTLFWSTWTTVSGIRWIANGKIRKTYPKMRLAIFLEWEMSFMLAEESLHLSSIYAIWLYLVDIENKNQQINVHMWAQWHDERRRRVARKCRVCNTYTNTPNTCTMPSRHRQHMCFNVIKSRSIFPFTALNVWIVCLVIIRIGFPWAWTNLQLAPAQLWSG